MVGMLREMNGFIEAHDRYLALDRDRTVCDTPQQREIMHIAILRAYLEVQRRALQIAGLQYAEGMDFADMH
jgi:hypothetical protein